MRRPHPLRWDLAGNSPSFPSRQIPAPLPKSDFKFFPKELPAEEARLSRRSCNMEADCDVRAVT